MSLPLPQGWPHVRTGCACLSCFAFSRFGIRETQIGKALRPCGTHGLTHARRQQQHVLSSRITALFKLPLRGMSPLALIFRRAATQTHDGRFSSSPRYYDVHWQQHRNVKGQPVNRDRRTAAHGSVDSIQQMSRRNYDAWRERLDARAHLTSRNEASNTLFGCTTYMHTGNAVHQASALTKKFIHFSICACHPCAGAMLIFSVSFQF